MAKQRAAWGIDIGQCALKALRCVPNPDGTGMVAEAFDYIEYPKILSQPDADPEVLIREALEQFLSRNEVRGDKVAISVSGQAGLSRFFKPPPVEAKTLPELVKYEAKQQIPFQLDDVIWDFQQIGGTVVEGLTVDAEIGIFAMKRDAVYKALKPFSDHEIEVDIIQLAPLAIYNVVLEEVLRDTPAPEDIDPSNPPESIVVLSMGTDTTDLVITDGIHLWQRNIPIGGSHFTKQLSRELKLTYAKAEQLKRNARKAENPKAVFQAMKPVFNDLVTEIQRSMSYFQGINKKAKIGRVMMLGNAAKLPGLRQFLGSSLNTEIAKIQSYGRLGGESVTQSKQFEDNSLAFAVSYGLCLQALDEGRLTTNLLPQEFVTERLIRSKKPWAVAGVGALLLACSITYFGNYLALSKVHPEKEIGGESWASAKNVSKQVVDRASKFKSTDQEKVAELEKVRQIQQEIAGQTDGRLLWAELYSAVYQARPTDERIEPGTPVDPKVVPYAGRKEIYIDSIETVYFQDISEWLTDDIKNKYVRYIDQQRRAREGLPPAPEPEAGEATEEAADAENADTAEAGATDGAAADETADETAAAGQANEGAEAPAEASGNSENAGLPDDLTEEQRKTLEEIQDEMTLEGPGWVIQLKGHHYFNAIEQRRLGIGAGTYVKNTLIRTLDEGTIRLPIPDEFVQQFGLAGKFLNFTYQALGIRYPVLTVDASVDTSYRIPNPDHPNAGSMVGGSNAMMGGGMMGGGMMGGGMMGGGRTGPGMGSGGMTSPGGGGSRGGRDDEGDGEGSETDEPLYFPAPRYDFTVQFAWQPVGLHERLIRRQQRLALRAAEEEAAGGSGTSP